MPKKSKPKWYSPNEPTREARQIYSYIYPGQLWPKGWIVRWVYSDPGALGRCNYTKKLITLTYPRFADPNDTDGYRDVLHTLVHEFVHMRGAKRHSKEFYELVHRACERLGIRNGRSPNEGGPKED